MVVLMKVLMAMCAERAYKGQWRHTMLADVSLVSNFKA